MQDVTKLVSQYVKDKGVSILALSEGTGIAYNPLRSSMTATRKLRADEFLTICDFLEVPPERFWKDEP